MTGRRSIGDLPSPRGLPLLGNAHQLLMHRTDAHRVVEEWCRRCGPIFRIKLGPVRRVVCVADVDAVNEILRDRPEGFRRWSEVESVFDEMGFGGVFSDEGDVWKRQRRLVVAALNSNKIQRYFHILRTANERLYRRLTAAAQSGEPLDIAAELTSYTVDIAAALAFGHDLNTLERRENDLRAHIERAADMLFLRISLPVPYWHFVRLPADRALDRSLVELHRRVGEFVDQARTQLEANPELRDAPENLLQAMLVEQQAEGTFSDDEIVGNALTLLVAGEDTTAHTVAWTLWFLATRPELQERWRQEASQVLDEHHVPTAYETLERLPFSEAALRESMRLKHVVPTFAAEAVADRAVMGTQIPAGTRLILLARYAGLHESGVGRAEEFDPDRWIEDGGPAPDRSAFLAFGAGPRFCPGRNLALQQAKAVMATIGRNFELELDESKGPVTEHLSFAMVPDGLRVRLRESPPVAAKVPTASPA